MKILNGWLALYAKIRNWATNKNTRTAIENAIDNCVSPPPVDEEAEIKELIKSHQYVVLQGAPGTGKTYTANKIARDYKEENVFFEQFHAESTYSDFIYGIEPDIKNSSDGVKFKTKKGILYKAIERARQLKEGKSNDRVLLIIDEINRANLSSVLGPVFYLFETTGNNSRAKIKVGELTLTSLPDNIDVIATMNTADRSLAVVDFALRRRFAWYTMKPRLLDKNEIPGKIFKQAEFIRFNDIFQMYATDEELSLQPGHSYFIVNKEQAKEEFDKRLQYELMPLIKEYLVQGYMPKAKESFSNLFYELIQKHLFE